MRDKVKSQGFFPQFNSLFSSETSCNDLSMDFFDISALLKVYCRQYGCHWKLLHSASFGTTFAVRFAFDSVIR